MTTPVNAPVTTPVDTRASSAMSDDVGLMPQNRTVRTIVVSGVLAAIQIALGITGLGLIPMPTGVNATILHIPAIVAGVMEGPIAGMAVGGIFGLFSFLRATTPLFQNPIIAFGPRLLIGVVAYFVYKALKPLNEVVALLAAGALGTLTNTVLVLSLAVLLPSPAGTPYLAPNVAWTVALTNAPGEVIVATIITVAVGLAIKGAGRARRSTV
ncbi:MAG TPA: ECF transporter S component [Candidatus Saccharimonadales bacterium]|nr:ECF transporter S component [Candidatus Saccharimonadales bacterium]